MNKWVIVLNSAQTLNQMNNKLESVRTNVAAKVVIVAACH